MIGIVQKLNKIELAYEMEYSQSEQQGLSQIMKRPMSMQLSILPNCETSGLFFI